MTSTLYDLLGVDHAAPFAVLRSAYKRRMLDVHPDKGGSVELCQRVVAAFELLADPAARHLYDSRLAKYGASRPREKCKTGLRPRDARGAGAAGRASPPGPVPPDVGRDEAKGTRRDGGNIDGGAAQSAKKTRVSAADGRSDVSAPSHSSNARFPTQCGDSRNSGCGDSRRAAPTRKISTFVIRVVCLLRRLPRDARRDFIGQRLSEAQRQAIETFMLSAAQTAGTPGGANDMITKQGNEAYVSSASSDESLGSKFGDSDEEAQVLALCDEAEGGAELATVHRGVVQLHCETKAERVLTWEIEKEQRKNDEDENQHERTEEEESEGCAETGALAISLSRVAEESVQDNKKQEEAKEEQEKEKPKETKVVVEDSAEEDESEDNEAEREWGGDYNREEVKGENEASAAGTGNRRAAAARIRGITHLCLKGRHFYIAKIGFDWIGLRARRRRSLERALDDHILLVAIKARVRAWNPDAHDEQTTFPRTFEDRLRSAIEEVFEENGVKSAEFGIEIHVSLPANHWIGRCLTSPVYTIGSLNTVLKVWRSFREARGQVGFGGIGLLFRCSPGGAWEIWERMREAYSEAWAQRGANVRLIHERLDALETAHSQRRRRQVEQWERSRMEREERLQGLVARALIVANARLRRMERRERVAMRQEDMRQQQRKLRRQSASVKERLDRLLALWNVQLDKVQRQEAILRARELKLSATARHREEQTRSRALHLQRQRRWRWLHRKDLTMDEILRGCPSEL